MKTRADGDCSKASELWNVGMTTCKPQPIGAADAVPKRSTFGTPEPVMRNHAQGRPRLICLDGWQSPQSGLPGVPFRASLTIRRLHAQVDTSWPDPKPPVNLWLYQ